MSEINAKSCEMYDFIDPSLRNGLKNTSKTERSRKAYNKNNKYIMKDK